MSLDNPPIPEDTDGENIKISKKDIKPLFDTNHVHQFVPTKEESDIEGTEMRVCKFCPTGIYVRR